MKIGVSSYSFSAYRRETGASYVALCEKARELGFDGIEFIDLSGDAAKEAKAIRAYCDSVNFPVIAYTVGADFSCPDAEAEAERLMRCADVAALLGAPVMRHDLSYRLPEGETWETVIDRVAPAVRAVSAYAETLGVRTCSENHGFVFQDSERMEYLMQKVDHPNYGWLVDIGNFLCVDEDPQTAVRRAAPYAVHAHAKDFLYRKRAALAVEPDGFFKTRNGNLLRGTVAGHGDVPIPACVAELRKAGYDGWLSLEFEGFEQNLPALSRGLTYLRRVCGEDRKNA